MISSVLGYGRGLGSQCYLTCLHASCNVATFNVWLFNAWYSCFNSNLTLLNYISFFILQSCFRAFDICPSSMQDFHCAMRYAILRSTIIHTPSCHYSYFVMPSLLRLIHPDGASLVHRSQTLLWYNQCNGGYDNFQQRFYIGEEEEGWIVWKYEYFFLYV